jgi:hypothetical protein
MNIGIRQDIGRWGNGERRLESPVGAATSTEAIKLPADLRDWINPYTLLTWIEEELTTGYESEPDSGPGRTRRPGTLLGVLCFAYACEILSSEEIVHATRTNVVLRLLAQEESYFEWDVFQFRRKHRSTILWLLAGVFARAIAWKEDVSVRNLSSEVLQNVIAQARERLDTARHLDVC